MIVNIVTVCVFYCNLGKLESLTSSVPITHFFGKKKQKKNDAEVPLYQKKKKIYQTENVLCMYTNVQVLTDQKIRLYKTKSTLQPNAN